MSADIRRFRFSLVLVRLEGPGSVLTAVKAILGGGLETKRSVRLPRAPSWLSSRDFCEDPLSQVLIATSAVVLLHCHFGSWWSF